jgi:hypothetical protein
LEISVTENTAPEYDGNTRIVGEEAPEAPQPGAPTAEEIEADSNLWAKAEAGDDSAVDENGNAPDDEA